LKNNKNSLSVGIVQDGPVHLNLEASLAKATGHIQAAAQQGADLVVFGETWLSGYPAWLDYCPNIALWDAEPVKAVFTKMFQNSVIVPGPETEKLAQLAQRHQLSIVIGVNERGANGSGNRTLYNSLLIFGPDGRLRNHHRKLMPTYTEKMLYGLGDGHGLQSVELPFGQLGGLICWEHWMPLARQTMHEQGETIHVALWPNVKDILQVASRHYAFEGRCFVIAVGQLMQVRDIPSELERPADLQNQPDAFILNGGSCIIGPDGQFLLEPQYEKAGLLMHKIENLDRIYGESMALDVTGHYNRPDVFDLSVDFSRKSNRTTR